METIIKDFALAWRIFDPELIIKHLSKDFVYDSQWVLPSLHYSEYIDYIRGKFNTFKTTKTSLQVDIVDDPYEGGRMIRIIQGNKCAYNRIKVDNGLVIKEDLCIF